MNFISRAAAIALAVAACTSLKADPVLPANIMDPRTPTEAWNVISLATANTEKLIKEKRLMEVPVQIALCSPSLRTLARTGETPEALKKLAELAPRAQAWVVETARASQDNSDAAASEALGKLRLFLAEMARLFDARTVNSAIYICPMHPEFASANAGTPCEKCGMKLVTRRIPYSFIYMKPGEPTIKLSATANGPAEAGKKLEVKVRLENGDHSPVLTDDLLVMHTQPIHLLIEDPSLSDYHHEHPVATDTPGVYAFSFTPKLTAPYRIWADIVPAATSVQEMPFADLPSTGAPGKITSTGTTMSSTAGNLTFSMSYGGLNSEPHAGQLCILTVTLADKDGKPVSRLEPVMNAFAHMVGFYDDYHTVVHIHPGGGDVLDQAARGGPALEFKLFPPRPGFVRLYCQVSVDGQMLFAPFNLNVKP